jgi:hypothetical protein
MITDKQKELLQHMLGADSRYKKRQWGFRNHYCAGSKEDCPDRLELEKLEKLGMVKSGERLGHKTFWATKDGAVAIGFKPYQLRGACLAT